MRIVTARRVSQVFFVLMFLWFCVATTLGDEWWQLRGWPVNWILSLDPLTAISTVFSTGTLYAPLLWALATLVLTLFVGRFFCGFACPLGALNQFVGWIGQKPRKILQRIAKNRPNKAQAIKYYLLAFLLVCAIFGSVQIGVFDPLPLIHRSINLTVGPAIDNPFGALAPHPRHYASAWLLAAVLLGILGMNLVIPRFFCRFVCPLGALFGLLDRFAPWRIVKRRGDCGDCHLCETWCEGACRPSETLVRSECVLCLNCMERCPHGRIGFRARPSAAPEQALPDLSRRGLLLAGVSGVLAVPAFDLGGLAGSGPDPSLIRPPGSLDEKRFLARCIRCGQCMRVCPTNVIQPALFQAGVQGIWTPVLDYRLGSSGCQLNCVACGQVCPTAAIRPLAIEEKLGVASFKDTGPVRMGTAFLDRTRCLPWAMNRPCLVCQEVCPVSPKAIYTETVYEPVRNGRVRAVKVDENAVEVAWQGPLSVIVGPGDHFLRVARRSDAPIRRIAGLLKGNRITLNPQPAWDTPPAPGDPVDILVRLQQPHIDVSRCIGCGVCEHECPVSRLRAIRVTSENETRTRRGRMSI